ncbi:MAG: hypothetical protein M0R03_16970 [Novosphingobium sp.]|nr:hypothetical protein [Novosphingobium sp.]
MKTLTYQLISKSGLNKNGVVFTKSALKNAVKNFKGFGPITQGFNEKGLIVGSLDSLTYKDGVVYGDIRVFDAFSGCLKNNVPRLAVLCNKTHKNNKDQIVLDDITVHSCAYIEKEKDGLIL